VTNLSQKNLNAVSLCSSFTVSEVILKKRSSEIYSIQDAFILDENLHLRKDFNFLNLASQMAKSILNFHFPQKKTNNIYLLLKSYLKKLIINPDALYLSFLLKLLHSEGLLNLKTQCSICKDFAVSINNGESLCSNHKNEYSFEFSKDDFKKLFILCYSKSFTMLKDIDVSKDLKQKVDLVFNDLI
jgi:DNA repair protein RecO